MLELHYICPACKHECDTNSCYLDLESNYLISFVTCDCGKVWEIPNVQ